jgi:mannan endo-1,4-beta-mannosidase
MEARPCNFAHHLALSTFIAIAVSFCAFPTISAAAQQLLLQQQQEADEVSPSSSSAASSSASSSSGGFAIAVGARFQVDGHALYLNGFNAYYLAYTAMDSPAMAAALLQRAAAAGFTLCRTWAFNDGSAASSYHAMQVAPGVYDEAAFRALDFVLQQARRLRLRLLLSLCNNYPNMGGKSRYVEWARSSSSSGGGDEIPSDDHFFTNPITKALYKNYVKVASDAIAPFSR